MTTRRRARGLVAALALVTTLDAAGASVLGSSASAQTRGAWRIAGIDRYQTSVDLSRAAYPNGAPTAVVVSGTAFPDGLAAGPLAALRHAPVLLTARDALPANVAAELQRLGAAHVTVVGGTAAVADPVLDAIAATTRTAATRVAGIDRYDTATQVAALFPTSLVTTYVAGGTTFPDALTAGAAAANAGVPLLLVAPDAVPPVVVAALGRMRPAELRVVGGVAAVKDTTVTQLRASVANIRRIAGSDRYATAAAVAAALVVDGNGRRPTEALVATAFDFPDALGAAPLAALRGAPILLTPAPCAPDATVESLRAMAWPDVTIVGGSAVVSSAAGNAVPCSPVPDGLLAPGVLLTTQVLPGPQVVHLITLDRRQGYDVRVVNATGRLQGLAPVSTVARRLGALAAVNGDFFLDSGEPAHAFAAGGRLLKYPGQTDTLVGFDPAKSTYAFFGKPAATVSVDLGTNTAVPIAGVNNGTPSGEQVALLTPESATALGPGSWCRAVLQASAPPALDAAGATTTPYLVQSAGCSTDAVPRGQDVLVASDGTSAGSTIGAVVAGGTATLRWHLHPTDTGVLDTVGANATLVFGGQVANDVLQGSGQFWTEHAARTAVARRSDGTVLLVTVDGRQTGWSIGMTPREMADYLVSMGAVDAANLDGGGSTALAAHGLLVNRPSDPGGERGVGTALVVVAHGA